MFWSTAAGVSSVTGIDDELCASGRGQSFTDGSTVPNEANAGATG